MRSMTGFGRSEISSDGNIVSAEVCSLNRKQIDIRLKLPNELAALEIDIRNRILRDITRGAIAVRVNINSDPGSGVSSCINHDAARRLLESLRALQSELGLPGPITLHDLFGIPEANIFSRPVIPEESLFRLAEEAIDIAMKQLISAKLKEGKKLKDDLVLRHSRLVSIVDSISNMSKDMPAMIRDRLLDRMRQLLEELTIDDDRFVKEVAFLAERYDVAEELTRLTIHLNDMKSLFDLTKPSGRKLDFLAQECSREINTIGAKCNDSAISKQTIEFKTELERIREQIQNIE